MYDDVLAALPTESRDLSPSVLRILRVFTQFGVKLQVDVIGSGDSKTLSPPKGSAIITALASGGVCFSGALYESTKLKLCIDCWPAGAQSCPTLLIISGDLSSKLVP